MSCTQAKVGNTIEVIRSDLPRFGERFVVTSIPKSSNGVMVKYGLYDAGIFYFHGEYKVVGEKPETVRVCSDKNVDTFLNSQRDDNLRSVFG